MTKLVDALKIVVGPKGWVTDEAQLEPHLTEWRGTWQGKSPIMVMPANAEQVSEIVSLCAAAGTPVVPQGGNTGLCGGAIPDSSGRQVLLSLSRMNRIRQLDATDYSMVVEAGCVLADLQAAAQAEDRLLALSLAAEGSCQIGGNLSTNAGGTNVLRYGTARAQVLGLEVVLADGRIWHGLRRLRKDTAGYDVKQLFVGSEGTLGIITAASLRLFPLPPNRQVVMLALASAQQAVDLHAALRQRLADQLLAFELISARALRLVGRHMPDARAPFEAEHPWYVLIDSAAPVAAAPLEEQFAEVLEEGLALDAILTKNDAEAQALWRLRHGISEAQKREGASLKHDVSVPTGDVARFIDKAEAAVVEAVPGARVVAFGHVGDGNVHFNVSQPQAADPETFLQERERMAALVYDIVDRYAGSISAEHGIGVLKREHLTRYRSPVEIDLMRRLKTALDPDTLLNPGKVL